MPLHGGCSPQLSAAAGNICAIWLLPAWVHFHGVAVTRSAALLLRSDTNGAPALGSSQTCNANNASSVALTSLQIGIRHGNMEMEPARGAQRLSEVGYWPARGGLAAGMARLRGHTRGTATADPRGRSAWMREMSCHPILPQAVHSGAALGLASPPRSCPPVLCRGRRCLSPLTGRDVLTRWHTRGINTCDEASISEPPSGAPRIALDNMGSPAGPCHDMAGTRGPLRATHPSVVAAAPHAALWPWQTNT